MNYLKHKIRELTIIAGLFMLCLMTGCEQEENKFKMNDGMQFKETAKSEQEATGNADNGQEGKNKNPDKQGTKEESPSMEELSTRYQEETEETSEDSQEETKETESQEEEQTQQQDEQQTEKPSSKQDKNKDGGNQKDDNKSGDKEGGSGNGDKDYVAGYNGETIEIYVDIEDE